jgi:Kef-type K+ transport system membrane component KefB
MDAFAIFLPLALILVISKLLSIVCKKIGLPQVIGLLFTGVILGLITLIPLSGGLEEYAFFSSDAMKGISIVAEIGVVLIMFSAGIETDLKQIKKTGVAALVITLLGVIVPMIFGFLSALLLNIGKTPDFSVRAIFMYLFYGVILTATSVSVTIAALKELGKLNTPIGTAIVSSAILDDIIGVIILSVILSLDKAVAGTGGVTEASDFISYLFKLMLGDSFGDVGWSIGIVVIKTVLFFLFALGLGIPLRKLFKKISNKYDHHRRVPIFAIAVAFFYAYASEKWFGIADITGAFFAGLILSGTKDTEYIERRTDIASYMIFTPVFFAKVGITSMSSFTSTSDFTWQFVVFGIVFIIAGILGKFLGCGLGAKMCKFSLKDSIRCGAGMMCRAEVCLICAQKGIDANIISASIQPFVLLLILITSFITPIILKQSYKNEIASSYQELAFEENNQGPSLDQ